MLRVHFNRAFVFFRHVIQREDGIGGAYRNAGAAINAVVRVDIELRGLFKAGLIFARMNAVNRANVNALFVFRTSLDNYVSHEINSLLWTIQLAGETMKS
jgi:hypothetical protein